jgi:hypothetical protein
MGKLVASSQRPYDLGLRNNPSEPDRATLEDIVTEL